MKNITHTHPRNAERQSAAHAAVAHYIANKGEMDGNFEADLEGFITDLLTDLRHLCGARGIDFDERARISADHYTAELTGSDE